eukprot:Rhum_TRINITY_DN2133_c0_g1::Rhum_TRINITY_DN2133_c0_g1_i1::g.6035::m.6035
MSVVVVVIVVVRTPEVLQAHLRQRVRKRQHAPTQDPRARQNPASDARLHQRPRDVAGRGELRPPVHALDPELGVHAAGGLVVVAVIRGAVVAAEHRRVAGPPLQHAGDGEGGGAGAGARAAAGPDALDLVALRVVVPLARHVDGPVREALAGHDAPRLQHTDAADLQHARLGAEGLRGADEVEAQPRHDGLRRRKHVDARREQTHPQHHERSLAPQRDPVLPLRRKQVRRRARDALHAAAVVQVARWEPHGPHPVRRARGEAADVLLAAAPHTLRLAPRLRGGAVEEVGGAAQALLLAAHVACERRDGVPVPQHHRARQGLPLALQQAVDVVLLAAPRPVRRVPRRRRVLVPRAVVAGGVRADASRGRQVELLRHFLPNECGHCLALGARRTLVARLAHVTLRERLARRAAVRSAGRVDAARLVGGAQKPGARGRGRDNRRRRRFGGLRHRLRRVRNIRLGDGCLWDGRLRDGCLRSRCLDGRRGTTARPVQDAPAVVLILRVELAPVSAGALSLLARRDESAAKDTGDAVRGTPLALLLAVRQHVVADIGFGKTLRRRGVQPRQTRHPGILARDLLRAHVRRRLVPAALHGASGLFQNGEVAILLGTTGSVPNAQLRAGRRAVDLLNAVFPGGALHVRARQLAVVPVVVPDAGCGGRALQGRFAGTATGCRARCQGGNGEGTPCPVHGWLRPATVSVKPRVPSLVVSGGGGRGGVTHEMCVLLCFREATLRFSMKYRYCSF